MGEGEGAAKEIKVGSNMSNAKDTAAAAGGHILAEHRREEVIRQAAERAAATEDTIHA